MTRLLAIATLLAACTLATAQAQAPARVSVEGAVHTADTFTVPPGGRLSAAALAAAPTPEAYPTGAMLLRRQALQPQVRLKAGLAHDLAELQRDTDDPALRAIAADLAAWLVTAPVTGRVRTELEPRRLEFMPEADFPAADGDRIVYPLRPATIRIVGAVVTPCELPHAPMRDARDYLARCPTRAADRDWLYIVQPDGEVHRLGIASWNRSPPQALAPGAVLYVPLPERALRKLDGDFNAEFAAFLATQPPSPPAGGPTP
ncbi:capsule biosynthesis GfcC family protein [Luteimonas sp. BDR2-5]|uniref:capsule biosynthesis GfcC family protein n=1 Tax=Proluteimonas luteida TaxID=2878685 RepID=UPI001E3ACCF9|nr:capsule biosynthesis GfcC family protein [Luteimonas sp. BDR2-5]MCD9028702.1 capsule biosynthesis GfcC family protein [Luteimonas sp. BDR2-5]